MPYDCWDPMCNSENYIDEDKIKKEAIDEFRKSLLEYMKSEMRWEDDHSKLWYENAMFDVQDFKFKN